MSVHIATVSGTTLIELGLTVSRPTVPTPAPSIHSRSTAEMTWAAPASA
jgi:hypothetical protein